MTDMISADIQLTLPEDMRCILYWDWAVKDRIEDGDPQPPPCGACDNCFYGNTKAFVSGMEFANARSNRGVT